MTGSVASLSPSPPPSVPFALPMMTYILVTKHPDRSVAHALDFDLVAVAPTEEGALAKLRRAIKSHVEFGIQRDWVKDILFKAPDEFWQALTLDTKLSIGESIVIDDSHLIRTAYTTTNEPELCSPAA